MAGKVGRYALSVGRAALARWVWQKQSSLSVPVAAANLPARPSGILFAKTLPAIRHALNGVLIKVQMRLCAELGFITL